MIYSRNPNTAQILLLDNTTLLENSNFNRFLPVKLFAHGWIDFPDRADGSVEGFNCTRSLIYY